MVFHQLYCPKCSLFYITKTTAERCQVCGTEMSADYTQQACGGSKRRSRMLVKHDGKLYQVVFKKIYRTTTHKKKKVRLIDTKCIIIAKKGFVPIEVGEPTNGFELCDGMSKQYIKDKYSKIIGKKYALLDALRFLSTRVYNTKAFRTALWKEFYETFGGWK